MDNNSFTIFVVCVIVFFVVAIVIVILSASYVCPAPQYFIVELQPKTPDTTIYGDGLLVLYNNELKYLISGTNIPIDTVANITVGTNGTVATILNTRILNTSPPAIESIGIWSSTNYTTIPFNSDMINHLNNGQLYVNMGVLQGKITKWTV
jgi:hypothetical protein